MASVGVLEDRKHFCCVLYSEFHPLKGPTPVCQAPPNFIHDDLFDAVSDYIITDPKLAGRLITVSALDYKLVGLPMCIDNAKYPRNQLLFNVTFVFDRHTDTVIFEPVIRKLAVSFRTLEKETALLSNVAERDRLATILSNIHCDLRQSNQCIIRVDDVHSINLRLFPNKAPPPIIGEHDVPIIIRKIGRMQHWDLCLQRVLPFIDGILHIRQLAVRADVDVELTMRAVQHLVYHGYCALIDIFQGRNEYVASIGLARMLRDSTLSESCLQYITADPMRRPHPIMVYRMFAAMRPGKSLSNICKELRPHECGIDERRLVAFGRVHGLIRRIHRFPMSLTQSSTGSREGGVSGSFPGGDSMRPYIHLSKFFDGAHCLDWIAAHHCEPVGQVESLIRSDHVMQTVIIDKIVIDGWRENIKSGS